MCVCVAVQICSLMRGGIAERGGVRVGHRIIEINGQSVVATAHEKIVQALSNSVGEVKHTHVHAHFSFASTSNTNITRRIRTSPVFSLPDPHENHAGCHVQTPDRTGDTHVHIASFLPRAADWFTSGGEGQGKDDFSTLFHFYFELMNLDLHLFPMQHFNMKRLCVCVCVCIFYLFALSVLLQSYFQTACAVSSESSQFIFYTHVTQYDTLTILPV